MVDFYPVLKIEKQEGIKVGSLSHREVAEIDSAVSMIRKTGITSGWKGDRSRGSVIFFFFHCRAGPNLALNGWSPMSWKGTRK